MLLKVDRAEHLTALVANQLWRACPLIMVKLHALHTMLVNLEDELSILLGRSAFVLVTLNINSVSEITHRTFNSTKLFQH